MDSSKQCESCKHWRAWGEPEGWGGCQRLTIGAATITRSGGPPLPNAVTPADFGCVEWVERGAAEKGGRLSQA